MNHLQDLQTFHKTYITPHLNEAICNKVTKILKRVSGRDWQKDSQTDQYLEVLHDVHKICEPGYPLDEQIIDVATSTIGAHMGIQRKGYRGRPYWHHQIMVVAIGWICGFNKEQTLTLFLHDDIEDLAKNWSKPTKIQISTGYAYTRCQRLAGTQVADNVNELSNPKGLTPETKHPAQCNKMKSILPQNKQCKSADRCGNLLDSIRDLAKGHNKPKRLAKEIIKAYELLSAGDSDVSAAIWSVFAFASNKIYEEMGLMDIIFRDPT